jgi:hypothetical protein
VVRADQKPGRRRALPEPRKQDERPTDAGPTQRLGARAARVLWFGTGLVAVVALGFGWSPLEVPGWVPTGGAVTVTTLYAYALAFRTGGRPVISGGLALALALCAVLSGLPVLVAGAAVGTAVLAGVLGVMATQPAARYAAVVRECLIAIGVAGVGAFAVEAYQAQVSLGRISYLALGLSLLGALGLVYRLGAGLHGIGRRGSIMLVSGLVLLFVIMAYTEALSRWGSPGVRESVAETVRDLRSLIGAAPRPLAVLLGFPALAWGVSTRARRRQGWWVCAFGAAGLTVVTVILVNPRVSLVEAGLTLLYSAVLGLALGYLVVRADTFLTGPRGRRARQLEEASAHRPEPGRLQPLL